jgi:hypothetical protein
MAVFFPRKNRWKAMTMPTRIGAGDPGVGS